MSAARDATNASAAGARMERAAPPQRVLVTGAAGFIGSTLVDRLLAEGREVVGYDSFDPFYPEAEKRRNLVGALASPRFRLERGDVRDAERLADLFAQHRFDGVVHLAALAGVRPSLERPVEYADVNVTGTSVVLQAAAQRGGARVVFASSSSVYGERGAEPDQPFRETDDVDHPISPYAATKKACELVAHVFHHAHGLPIVAARIFTAYGPRQRPDLAIRKFVERMRRGEPIPVFGDGSAVRDFTFVEDLVTGLVAALDRDLGYTVLNFGAGRTTSVIEVVRALERALGVAAKIDWQPRQTGDVSRTWADTTRARTLIGYAPATRLDEGIARFVAWLEENP
ncbi:MAG TPA: SDR family NAD(P)-dependent oxidoreductase [Myxococcota bacterium]|nr:SDR family NAD(P)-dependent oxidoreductase [Myxococcota bacterium]